MAIHFNYIKGLNGDVTKLSENTTTSDSNDLYTFIKWAGRAANTDPDKDAKYLPHIYVERTNALSSNDLGYIITSNATNQSFYEDITMLNQKACYYIAGSTIEESYWGKIFFNVESGGSFKFESGSNFYITAAQSIQINTGTSDGNKLTINTKESIFNGKIKVNSDSNANTYVEISEGDIIAKGHIDSLYFNATSDQRAKSHIQLFKSNALNIVNTLPVYEFHYRNNDTPSIGVLAQDAITFDEQFTDFSLVNNPNASGENGDYMTIKESKLIYVLWKAVQEQQEQIERLQEELNKLKESQ